MKKPLQILIVEDNPADAKLLVAELRAAGFEPTWKRIETEADFLAEIKNLPDIILSDYSMPEFSGFRAAELLHASGLDIPFILISGTVGEDVAVEAMKHGASDYLLKDRIARLGSAVERALGEMRKHRELKKAEQQINLQNRALEQVRERLVLATASAHIGIWDWDIAANKLVWDAQMYELYGIREQGFGGAYDAWQKGLHPDDRARGEAATAAAIAGVKDFDIEFRVLWPNGEVRHLEAHAVVQRAGNGSATRMTGVNWDITERKRAEQHIADELNFSHTMLEVSPVGIMTYTTEGDAVSINLAAAQIVGAAVPQLEAQNFRNLESWKRSGMLEAADHALQTGQPQDLETHLVTTFGKEVWLSCRFVPFRHEDRGHLLCLLSDITERKQAAEEIQNQLHELRRWHEVMLGREDRILELKHEVNELLTRHNQSERYSIPTAS